MPRTLPLPRCCQYCACKHIVGGRLQNDIAAFHVRDTLAGLNNAPHAYRLLSDTLPAPFIDVAASLTAQVLYFIAV